MLGVLDEEERKECFGGQKENRKSTSEDNQRRERVFSRVESTEEKHGGSNICFPKHHPSVSKGI